MAKSMIKRRQEADRERNAAFEATLRRVQRVERPAPDFERALNEARRGFEGEIVRDAWAWRPKLKTRDQARLRLAAARHLFARYPVPAHLEEVWRADPVGMTAAEVRLRKHWYVVAAKGGSLYKAGASEWLSRREVHAFLNAPAGLDFDQAFGFAVASTYAAEPATALLVARTRISRTERSELGFWREVARFFCANPATSAEIDDLCDFIAARHRRDQAYSLKGRTLATLKRASDEWHRDVAAVARIEAARRAFRTVDKDTPDAGRWAGSPLADWSWQPSGKDAKNRREEFAFTQLVTADELVAESRAMHHCVWTYAQKCIAGQASIWSMRRRTPGRADRLLTIELDRGNRAVQVRGFGNRVASAEEDQVLGRWAKARGIALLT